MASIENLQKLCGDNCIILYFTLCGALLEWFIILARHLRFLSASFVFMEKAWAGGGRLLFRFLF